MADFLIIFFKKIIYINLNFLIAFCFASIILKIFRIKRPSVRYIVWGILITRFFFDLFFCNFSPNIISALPEHGILSIGVGCNSALPVRTIRTSVFDNFYNEFAAGDITAILIGPEITVYAGFAFFVFCIYNFCKNLFLYFLFRKKIEESLVPYDIKNKIKIYLCDFIDTPFVSGVIRPFIVLPLSISCSFEKDEIDAVINHELAHIERKDNIIVPFLSFLKSLFIVVFPLTMAVNKLEEAEEEICDRIVLMKGKEKKVVASALLNLVNYQVNLRLNYKLAFSHPNFLKHKHMVEKRLMNIYKSESRKFCFLSGFTAGIIYILAFLFVFGLSIL